MIPPRPWRVVEPTESVSGGMIDYADIEDANGNVFLSHESPGDPPDRATAEYIVRLVNAEPEIVAALEAADKMLLACAGLAGHYGHADAATEGKAAADAVRAALAKVRP